MLGAGGAGGTGGAGCFARTVSHQNLLRTQRRRRPSGISVSTAASGAGDAGYGGAGISHSASAPSLRQGRSSDAVGNSSGREGMGEFTTEGMTKGAALRKQLEILQQKRSKVLRARAVLSR